jgi:NAD+ kinase
MNIQSIGLFGNPATRGIIDAVQLFKHSCHAAAIDLHLTAELADLAAADAQGYSSEELVARSDVVIALGGDGTMLRAARTVVASNTPLLGINLGSLGYLTDVPYEDAQKALDQLLAGEYHLENRTRVACDAWRQGERIHRMSALNDIVVNMGPQPRALDLEVNLEGESLGRFLGDGLIVSSPTGSTAYNLSAGGPICHSRVACLLMTPICPHTLGMRPLIVSADTELDLLLHEVGQGAALTADGQESELLHNGDRVTFRVDAAQVQLVKFPESNFYRVMRHKLNWGAPPRRGNGW